MRIPHVVATLLVILFFATSTYAGRVLEDDSSSSDLRNQFAATALNPQSHGDDDNANHSSDWTKKPVKTPAPLIGVLAQACYSCPGRSYVAAGFVKWIEAAGARAVPIRFYESEAELKRLFNAVNGIIFPGGLTDIYWDDPYTQAAHKLWKWAREANDKGDVFPIHGTCLGFQLLHILESNMSFTELLVDTDSVAHPANLYLTEDAADSHLFREMDSDLIEKIQDPDSDLAMENHVFGLPPDMYEKYPILGDNFKLLSTTLDRNGTRYISTAEHKTYPFTATQWHPEKPPFEFGMKEIPHSMDAIRVSQHLANVFIDAARRSGHAPESPEEELDMVIYNWKPWFTLKDSLFDESYDGPDMCYFFDEKVPEPHDKPDDALFFRGGVKGRRGEVTLM